MTHLWIDTNCARSAAKIADLARLARTKGVRVRISPQVYLERRRQMRVECEERGKAFHPAAFDDFLTQNDIEVPPLGFDQKTAGSWADMLCQRYPTSRAWETAKQRTLGGQMLAGFEVLPGDMPMTTDWLIALTVEGDAAARIITRDTGEEWRVLRDMTPPRALTWEEALEWLHGQVDP